MQGFIIVLLIYWPYILHWWPADSCRKQGRNRDEKHVYNIRLHKPLSVGQIAIRAFIFV